MTDYKDKKLESLIGADLARLAVPKQEDISKIMLGDDLASQLQKLSKQMSKVIEGQQLKMLGISPQIVEIAKNIEKNHKSQLHAFQSISQSLQPLISQQSRWAQDMTKIGQQISPALEAIRTMSSFNAFQTYRETFAEFGGNIDPDNVTQEEIERTIEENKELIKEVNGVVLQAELEGISPGDTPALIFSFLIKRVPNLSKRTYGIIVLIFTTAVIFYGLYSNYSTNTTLDEIVVPVLEDNSEKLEKLSQDQQEIKGNISDNHEEIKDLNENIDSTKSAVDDLQKDFDSYQEKTNDKLDLILEKMRKTAYDKKE